jgi:hypothetical protein
MSAVTTAHHARSRGWLLQLAGTVGLVGAFIGAVAGLVELTAGPAIGDWVGGKSDTTGLGIATFLLSLAALAAAVLALRRDDTGRAGRLAISSGLLLPGVICFTTVGTLWYVPGPLLLAAGLVAAISVKDA